MKDRSIYALVPGQGDQHISNKASNAASLDGKQTLDENGKVVFVQNFTCYFFLFVGFYFIFWRQHLNIYFWFTLFSLLFCAFYQEFLEIMMLGRKKYCFLKGKKEK